MHKDKPERKKDTREKKETRSLSVRWEKGEKILTCAFEFHDSFPFVHNTNFWQAQYIAATLPGCIQEFSTGKGKEDANTPLSWKFRKHFCVMEKPEE